MVIRAMRDFNTAPEQTFLIGDSDEDMQAGAAAGCRTVRAGEGEFAAGAEQVMFWLASLASGSLKE